MTDRARFRATDDCKAAIPVVLDPTRSLAYFRLTRFWRVTLGSIFLVALFGAVLWRGGFPVLPPREALASVSSIVIATYVVNWTLILLIRAARWRFLLVPVGHVSWWKAIRVALVAFGALCLLPLRLGEAVRPTLISRGTNIGWWEAAGTVGAERILDGLFLSASLAFCLFSTQWLTPLPHHIGNLPVPVAFVPVATTAALATFATLFIALGLFYWSRDFTQKVISRSVGVVSKRAAVWLTSAIARTATGLTFLPKWRYTGPFIVLTVAYWLLNASSMLWLMHGCGLHGASLGQAWVAMGVLGLGVVVPNAPGYFGAFQLSLFAGLALYFRPNTVVSNGAVFVFYAYVIQLCVSVAIAVGAWITDAVCTPRPETTQAASLRKA